MSVKADRARRIAQTKTKSFKSTILENGATLSIDSYEKKDSDDGNPIDFLLCTNDKGETIKLSVRDFNALVPIKDNTLVRLQEENIEVYPKTVKIEGSEPRLDREGNPYKPAFAYNDSKKFYDSLGTEDAMDFADLVASGVKEGSTVADVQNYTVSTNF